MKHCLNRPLSFGCEAVILKSLSKSRQTSTFLRLIRKRPLFDAKRPYLARVGPTRVRHAELDVTDARLSWTDTG
jgi:hypothetical protein